MRCFEKSLCRVNPIKSLYRIHAPAHAVDAFAILVVCGASGMAKHYMNINKINARLNSFFTFGRSTRFHPWLRRTRMDTCETRQEGRGGDGQLPSRMHGCVWLDISHPRRHLKDAPIPVWLCQAIHFALRIGRGAFSTDRSARFMSMVSDNDNTWIRKMGVYSQE